MTPEELYHSAQTRVLDAALRYAKTGRKKHKHRLLRAAVDLDAAREAWLASWSDGLRYALQPWVG